MRKLFIVIAAAVIATFTGCKALIEENIRGSKVNVLFPKTGDSLNTYNVTFWWDQVPDATSYELQLVQGTFSNIQNFILDSTITSTRYTYILTPGTYQWRVRALNNSTQTDFTTQSFVVLRNDSLGAQGVILQYPPDNFFSNHTSQTFRWYPIPQTTYYTFQLLTAAGGLVYTTDLTTDTIVLDNIQQGELQWRVRASDNSSSTAFTTRALNIDSIAPNTPIAISPANGDSVNTPFTISWDRGVVSGSSIVDSLYLYSDSLITLYQQVGSASTSYSVSSIPVGTYFWRVRSTDQTGNTSGYSTASKFRVH